MELNPWFILLLGMATVFVGLICLIYLMKLMSYVVGKFPQAKPAEMQENTEPALEPPLPAGTPVIADRRLFSAVVASAIAAYTGAEAQGLRILSVRPLAGENNMVADRRQFTAVLSAAIAAYMHTDVSGLRIHSITKL